MDDMYREFILDHYRHPHNFGELADFTFEAEGVNPLCGDEIKVQVKVEDGHIADLRFSGNGCAISQASMSMLTDEMIGKPLEAIIALDRSDILKMVGIELTPMRVKCAVLGLVVTKMGVHEHTGAPPPAGLAGMDEIAWDTVSSDG